jgi:hypothetical protein
VIEDMKGEPIVAVGEAIRAARREVFGAADVRRMFGERGA